MVQMLPDPAGVLMNTIPTLVQLRVRVFAAQIIIADKVVQPAVKLQCIETFGLIITVLHVAGLH